MAAHGPDVSSSSMEMPEIQSVMDVGIMAGLAGTSEGENWTHREEYNYEEGMFDDTLGPLLGGIRDQSNQHLPDFLRDWTTN